VLRFKQEVGADFVSMEGQVFPDFNRDRHVKPCAYDPRIPVCIGLDFGYRTCGWVAAQVDTAARRLSVNQLRVDYSAAQVSGFTGGQPVNGDLIEATGALNASGVLVATRLERRSSSLPGTTNDKAELEGLVTRFDVRGTEAGGLDTVTRQLSGGNMQKLILGRALGGATPALVLANQPTWGLDVRAVAYVHQQLLDACAAGAAVLLISEDLDEILTLADRIAVIHHGRLTPAEPTEHWTLARIGLAMAGGATHAA
jgi:hypothetical protein